MADSGEGNGYVRTRRGSITERKEQAAEQKVKQAPKAESKLVRANRVDWPGTPSKSRKTNQGSLKYHSCSTVFDSCFFKESEVQNAPAREKPHVNERGRTSSRSRSSSPKLRSNANERSASPKLRGNMTAGERPSSPRLRALPSDRQRPQRERMGNAVPQDPQSEASAIQESESPKRGVSLLDYFAKEKEAQSTTNSSREAASNRPQSPKLRSTSRSQSPKLTGPRRQLLPTGAQSLSTQQDKTGPPASPNEQPSSPRTRNIPKKQPIQRDKQSEPLSPKNLKAESFLDYFQKEAQSKLTPKERSQSEAKETGRSGVVASQSHSTPINTTMPTIQAPSADQREKNFDFRASSLYQQRMSQAAYHSAPPAVPSVPAQQTPPASPRTWSWASPLEPSSETPESRKKNQDQHLSKFKEKFSSGTPSDPSSPLRDPNSVTRGSNKDSGQFAIGSKIVAGNGYAAAKAIAAGAHGFCKMDDLHLAGVWMLQGEKVGTIKGSTLLWSDTASETVLSRQGDDIIIEIDGVQYTGNAGLAEGEIHWSDGDVWLKETKALELSAPGGDLESIPSLNSPTSKALELSAPGGDLESIPSLDSPREFPHSPLPHSPFASPKLGLVEEVASSPLTKLAMLSLDGDWYLMEDGEFQGTISEGDLTWSDGRETKLSIEGGLLTMELDGDKYEGKLFLDKGQIRWSDGDIWERRGKQVEPQATIASAVSEELAEPCTGAWSQPEMVQQAVELPPVAHSAPLDGDWILIDDGTFIAKISGVYLFWEDGQRTSLSLKGQDITMNLDGEEHIGKLSLDRSQIVWSDGETWECRSKQVEPPQPTVKPTASEEPGNASLDGVWNLMEDGSFIAEISGKYLFWEDGHRSSLSIQEQHITMNLDGEEQTGQLSVDNLRIMWSDGEVWQREMNNEITQEASQSANPPASPDAQTMEELAMELSQCKTILKELQRREMEWMHEKEQLETSNQQLLAALRAQHCQ